VLEHFSSLFFYVSCLHHPKRPIFNHRQCGEIRNVLSIQNTGKIIASCYEMGISQWIWSWAQWPRGLRRRSVAACFLGLRVRIPPGAWMYVCCEFCVMSGRGFCNEVMTRPEESYRLWCVVECDLETSWVRRAWPTVEGGSCRVKNKQTNKQTVHMIEDFSKFDQLLTFTWT